MPAGSFRGRPQSSHLTALNLSPGTHAYLCGPPAFMTAIQRALLDTGVQAGRIHIEAFGAAQHPASTRAPHPPASEPPDGIPVTFASAALTVNWSPAQGTLLELAEACDVPVPWSCRSGVCHRCQTGIIAGDVRYDPPPIDPPPGGAVLVCCATPQDTVVLDL